MEKMEGNKLIAIFMDYTLFKTHNGVEGLCTDINDMSTWLEIPKLQYHSDWSKLMEVVEKIAKDYDVTISLMPTAIDTTSIYRPDLNHDDSEISSMGGMTAIENTWEAVVRFIEWYNTKSKHRKKK